MGIDATSSLAGAAVSLRQAQGQQNFGVNSLKQAAQQQETAVATLLQGASGGGGNVTATRGQNLNITV